MHFTTNEHTALTVQFPGKPVSPQLDYTFPAIEENLIDIKVVRYVAPILQVKLIDQENNEAKDAKVRLTYVKEAESKPAAGREASVSFEAQGNGIYRSESLCPDLEFIIYAEKDGMESERKRMTMKEGKNDLITLTLKRP